MWVHRTRGSSGSEWSSPLWSSRIAISVTWNVPKPHAVHEVQAKDGYPITLRRHGNPAGPRLVVCHGNGFAIDAYWPFWSQFTDGFDVFVHDVRGHGWNPVGGLAAHSIPTIAEDFACLSRSIDRYFGAKPKIGIFHSLTALTTLHSQISDGYLALVLFDPPLRLPGRAMGELEKLGLRMGAATRKRRDHFETLDAYVELLSSVPAFECMDAENLDLLARTTLRPASVGGGYELRCPREHEAQLWDSLYPFAGKADFRTITCPVKVIGSDPTVPNSFLPGTAMPELLRVDYDFVPETTHLLQLEKPQTCATFTLEYFVKAGLLED